MECRRDGSSVCHSEQSCRHFRRRKASEGALSIIGVWRAGPDELFAIVNDLSEIQVVLQSANEASIGLPPQDTQVSIQAGIMLQSSN